MNIVVVRLSAIGDCCLVLPLVRAILQQNPYIKIDWLIGKAAYQLLQYSTHPRLNYRVIDKPNSVSDYRSIYKLFKGKNIDAVLAMQASTRANLICPCIKAPKKIGFDKSRARELQWLWTNQRIDFKQQHLHDSFCQFADALGLAASVNNQDWQIKLAPDHAELLKKFSLPKNYLVINPAASKLERCWRAESYAELIDWLYQEYQINVVLTGAAQDFELALVEEIMQRVQSKPINLLAKTNLPELAVILKHAQLLIAPDTGPVHIANGVGTHVIGLYAVVSSRLSGPYLHQELVLDKFEQAVAEILNEDPQRIPWRTRVHDRAAMDLIQVEEVQQKVASVLASNKSN
ncbi:glycosyltransferase family 9 protein [Kangiella sp. TOML190]|uniref:glycosyltransferase family 9 protein n=1 Tax=Kangiella sp. TOML190 TaxID=2931351 RepID=UPI00203F1ADF|nr:glycosyltransferase family 9 protein [Kangiella sp. TOML190]